MKWQRIAGLLAAGAGLLALTLWLSRSPSPAPSEPAGASIATNRLSTNSHSPARTLAARRAPNPAGRPAPSRAAVNRPLRPGAAAPARPSTSRTTRATNAPPARTTGLAAAPKTFGERLARWRESRYFYPAVALAPLLLGVIFLLVASNKKGDKSEKPAGGGSSAVAPRLAKRKGGKSQVHACNVLQTGPERRQLWNFAARGGGFTMNREHVASAGDPLPPKVINKEWRALWQPKLNVAWLAPGQVFFRVTQFPLAQFAETLAMVELQLEKLSPMPVAQVVWTLHILPHSNANMQTVIVVLAARNVVEEYLGRLEAQGYLADRLEVSFIDQLLATPVTGNGAWVYPVENGIQGRALVAWWYDGVLHDLGAISLPATNGPAQLKEQLLQLAWAGELEGWLTAPPAWRLVADPTVAAQWEPALREALEQPIEIIEPVAARKLAALTAVRAAEAESRFGLLPPEFATRYHQLFVDRLWMRALGGAVGLYIVGVCIYFVAVQFAAFRTRAVENQVAELATAYTNTIQLKAKMEVLKERQDLKYAALDCWKAVAELLPADVTLESFNFSDGHRLTLTGSAPPDSGQEIIKFDGALRKVTSNDKLLFDPNKGDFPNTQRRGANLSWSLSVELKHAEAQ